MSNLLQNILKSETLAPKKDQIVSVLQDGRDEVLISTIKLAAKLNAKPKLTEQQKNTRNCMVHLINSAL